VAVDDRVAATHLPWVVLGRPGSKRSRGLQAARAALGLAPARIVEWFEWLSSPDVLAAALQEPCHFKIEPPGDDPRVHLYLLHAGCDRLGRERCDAPEHGELLGADAWFEGFRVAMQQIDNTLSRCPQAKPVNRPSDIVAMTDKLACQQQLQAHGVPTPRLLGPVESHESLQSLLDAHSLDRIFVKARYGSSAAGVLAYRRNRRGAEQVTTSASLEPDGTRERIFNVKRMRRYEGRDDVRRVVNAVAQQGAYAESWLAKPRLGGNHFDLRVLALDGRAAHRVARVGASIMTNLHLDNERRDPALLLTSSQLERLTAAVERAADLFAESRLIGFDLVVNGPWVHVLEANAFGDLLPGLLWHGHDTHAALAATPAREQVA
jgi:hypothetical protein